MYMPVNSFVTMYMPYSNECSGCYNKTLVYQNTWGTEEGLPGVGWWDGEKMKTIVTE